MTSPDQSAGRRCGTCGWAKLRDGKLWCGFPVPFGKLWCGFPVPFWLHDVGSRTHPEGPSWVTAEWGEQCATWKPGIAPSTDKEGQ